MNTMKWLLRREYWEHKGSFFWAPAVVALVMVAVVALTIGYGMAAQPMDGTTTVVINGHQVTHSNMINAMGPDGKAMMANAVANGYIMAAAPLFGVLPFVVFFYCLSALYDDRRDRSILFWKSLPISDRDTVISKVVTALVLAPVITALLGVVTAAVIALITMFGAGFFGVHIVGAVLANKAFWLAPFQLIGLLPVCAVGGADRGLAAAGVELGKIEGFPVGGRPAPAAAGAAALGQLHHAVLHERGHRRQMGGRQYRAARSGQHRARLLAAFRSDRTGRPAQCRTHGRRGQCVRAVVDDLVAANRVDRRGCRRGHDCRGDPAAALAG